MLHDGEPLNDHHRQNGASFHTIASSQMAYYSSYDDFQPILLCGEYASSTRWSVLESLIGGLMDPRYAIRGRHNRGDREESWRMGRHRLGNGQEGQ